MYRVVTFVGVVGSWYQAFDKDKVRKFPTDDATIKRGLMSGCVVSHTSAMIRKSVLVDNHISYEDAFSPSEDYALWCAILCDYRTKAAPEFKNKLGKIKL
ncbi:MAG: hypothetical protein SO314_02445 [Alphaproteobacteria bacterium]|nr:hypothetical protein [Alphaproteobacteria bacterium]